MRFPTYALRVLSLVLIPVFFWVVFAGLTHNPALRPSFWVFVASPAALYGIDSVGRYLANRGNGISSNGQRYGRIGLVGYGTLLIGVGWLEIALPTRFSREGLVISVVALGMGLLFLLIAWAGIVLRPPPRVESWLRAHPRVDEFVAFHPRLTFLVPVIGAAVIAGVLAGFDLLLMAVFVIGFVILLTWSVNKLRDISGT